MTAGNGILCVWVFCIRKSVLTFKSYLCRKVPNLVHAFKKWFSCTTHLSGRSMRFVDPNATVKGMQRGLYLNIFTGIQSKS